MAVIKFKLILFFIIYIYVLILLFIKIIGLGFRLFFEPLFDYLIKIIFNCSIFRCDLFIIFNRISFLF